MHNKKLFSLIILISFGIGAFSLGLAMTLLPNQYDYKPLAEELCNQVCVPNAGLIIEHECKCILQRPDLSR